LFNVTTGAFDVAWTHDLHITNQMCNPLRLAAPCQCSICLYKRV